MPRLVQDERREILQLRSTQYLLRLLHNKTSMRFSLGPILYGSWTSANVEDLPYVGPAIPADETARITTYLVHREGYIEHLKSVLGLERTLELLMELEEA